jgi:predicted branched-subunit amino acid permease
MLEVARPALRGEARGGALAMAPLLLGYAPFALVVGRAAAECPEPAAGWAATLLVYGGSAHLAVVQLLDAGAGVVAVVLTGLVVQARLVAYSASLAPHWAAWSGRARAVGAATIIDPTWALAQHRFARSDDGDSDAARRAWYLGAAATLTVGWTALVTVGFVAGAQLPSSPGWTLVSPLLLLTLVVPHLGGGGARRAVAAAVVVAVAGTGLPAGVPVLLAMVAGAVAGGGRA